MSSTSPVPPDRPPDLPPDRDEFKRHLAAASQSFAHNAPIKVRGQWLQHLHAHLQAASFNQLASLLRLVGLSRKSNSTCATMIRTFVAWFREWRSSHFEDPAYDFYVSPELLPASDDPSTSATPEAFDAPEDHDTPTASGTRLTSAVRSSPVDSPSEADLPPSSTPLRAPNVTSGDGVLSSRLTQFLARQQASQADLLDLMLQLCDCISSQHPEDSQLRILTSLVRTLVKSQQTQQAELADLMASIAQSEAVHPVSTSRAPPSKPPKSTGGSHPSTGAPTWAERVSQGRPATKARSRVSAGARRRQAQRNAVTRQQRQVRCDERTLMVSPQNSRMLNLQISYGTFGKAVTRCLRDRITDLPDTWLEDVRRDSRGRFYIQVHEKFWGLIKTHTNYDDGDLDLELALWDYSLADLGRWDVHKVVPSVTRGLTPFVLSNVHMDFDLEDFGATFIHSNLTFLGLDKSMEASRFVRPRRLNRRSPSTGAWEPSLAIVFYVDDELAKVLSAHDAVRFDYTWHPLQRYSPPPLRCSRCGQRDSHRTRDCRSAPRCRHCAGSHETSTCPTRSPAAVPSRGTPSPHHVDAADDSGRPWTTVTGN